MIVLRNMSMSRGLQQVGTLELYKCFRLCNIYASRLLTWTILMMPHYSFYQLCKAYAYRTWRALLSGGSPSFREQKAHLPFEDYHSYIWTCCIYPPFPTCSCVSKISKNSPSSKTPHQKFLRRRSLCILS